MKKLLFPVVALILLLSSCKKSDDNKNEDCTLTTANVVGSYKITAVKYKLTPATPEYDAYDDYLEDCQKDDIYVFNADGTLNYNDVGTVCSPSGTTSGTWLLSGNNLTVDGQSFTITSFNCRTVVGTVSDLATSGDKATFTFTKQ